MTPQEFKSYRRELELSRGELANILNLSNKNGWRLIKRIEEGSTYATPSLTGNFQKYIDSNLEKDCKKS